MRFDFNSIPKVCISLKRSDWRRMMFEQELKKFRPPLEVPYFDAIDKLDIVVPKDSVKLDHEPHLAAGVLACAMSHIEVLKRADALKLPAISVLEDDCILHPSFAEAIEHLQNLVDFDFDIFCLGGHFRKVGWLAEDAHETQWPNIYKVDNMGGTHALIWSRKAYLEAIRLWNYNWGADEFNSKFIYRNFNTYALVPFMVGTRDCKSDITDAHFESINCRWFFDPNKPLKLT